MRTLTATLVVPVVVVCGFLLASAFGSTEQFEDFGTLVFALIIQYFFFLAFTCAAVVPLRLFWRRWDFMRAWVAVVIGAVLGGGMMIAFGFAYSRVPAFSSQPIPSAEYARAILILAVIGAAAGYIFWLIAHPEMRPNKSLERTHER